MKNFKLFNQSLRTVGSPNQTNETLTRENRLGIVTCLNPLRTLCITLLLLTLGVGQMWGASIFNCGIDVNGTWYKGTGTINSGNWLGNQTAFNSANLGVLTSLELGGQYDTWDNNQTDYCSWNTNNGIWITIYKNGTQKTNFKLSCFHDSFSSNNNTWKTSGTIGGCSDSGSWGTYSLNISAYTPGNDYTIKASWTSPSGQSTNATALFTIPGFTSLSTTSVTFDNTTVGDNNSKSITYTHYGTAPTNVSDRYSITGTNADQFSITALNGTEATIKFTPTSAGTKTATLVINDVHGKTTGSITLSGTGTAPTVPTIILSSATPSALVSGNDITLVGTRANSSNTISFQYTTNDGSTWNDITPKTSSLSSNTLTVTWTVPEAHGATQTYKFRAKLAEATPIYSSKSSAVTVYGKKTIHVKNTNNWGTLYLYAWDSEENKLNGNWPGTTGAGSNGLSCTKTGGQWWDVVITSQVSGFILNANVSGDAYQTADLLYTTYTDDRCLAIGTASGKKTLTNTAETCPSAPSVTTAAATSLTNTSATFNASGVANGNDAITAYGFKWGTTTECTNTQAASNLSSATFSFNKTGLTAGTTYYFKAYATNGQGTTYGDVKSFKAPYKVTITKPAECASMSPTGTQYTSTYIDITASAATGYTWTSWDVTNGTKKSETATSLRFTPTADNATVTATYTPADYVVTLDKNTGSADGSVTTTYNSSTTKLFTAATKTGYNCTGYWTATSGGYKVVNADGTLASYSSNVSTYLNSNGTWKKTDATTLYAQWTPKTYAVTLDKKEGSTNGSATATYDAAALTSITAPTRTGYHVEGYYGETGLTNKVATDAGVLQSDVAGFTTGTAWTKDATATLYTKWTPNTYTIAFNANDANYVGTATGTTASIAATYDVSYTLTANGFSRTGYTFAGWNTNADGTSGTNYTNSQTGVSNLTATNGETVTLYAKWTGITYTVTFNARGGSGLTPTSKSVTMGSAYGALATVTPPAGYIFDGWYTASVGGTKVTGTTQVTTASDHTLYAHYVQKAQVYFKNTLGWDKVYVTYDAYWVTGKGAGNNGKTYHKMKLVAGTTDVYYDDIPDAVLSSWKWNIAFDNTGFCAAAQKENPTTGTSQEFFGGEAVFRYDFDSKATMFVPTSNTNANEDGNFNDVNSTQYRSTGYSGEDANPKYTSGYWRTYNDTYSGYTMTYEKNGTNSWSSGHKMESNNVGGNSFIYTVTMDANSQYNFAFYKEREVNTRSVQFRYGSQITSSACTDLKLVCDPNNAWMKTTVAGDYTFILTMGNDGHLYLTVDYPFGTNDYKVVYSYTKDGAKTYESEIIKGRADGIDTISVFIHSSSDASSRSLKIARCTDVNASGVATWNNSYATIDISSITKSGVYNFIITQDGSATATGAYWKKYTGNYYIRTNVADGGWDLYKYREDNKMTLSEYSLTQTLSAPYSHYYCRYVESTDIDITYAVATDYSPNISGILVGDATIGGDDKTKLPASANVRFTYNENTNGLFRAYLKSAQGSGNTRFLVLHGDEKIFDASTGAAIMPVAGQSLAANELLFSDLGNWIYQVELQAYPSATVKLIAKYNDADRYLVGDADHSMKIMGGTPVSTKYAITAVYDFKTNRLMTVWTPSDEIKETLTDVDVLLIRHAQDPGVSITFGSGGSLTTKKVYGALEFQYDELVGHVANWTSSSRPLLKFFVSFPFDVNVSDIFGLNSAYGDAYVIEEYDGAERAEKGFFRGDGTTTFWKEMKAGDVMKANVGYCVIMDNDYLNNDIGHVWDNKSEGSKVYLYFPSVGDVGSITSIQKTIKIPEHECKIDRTFTVGEGGSERTVNHMNTDSHWNMMGVPVFVSHTGDATAGTPGAVFAESGTDGDGNFNYFYEWSSDNQFVIHTARGYTFKSMHGYMVQYHGNVTFTGATTTPAANVAARHTPVKENYQIELQVLDDNEDVLNRTYVELRENADDEFILNEDVYLSQNNHAVEIFTFAGNYDVAANVLPIENKIVPVGVEVRKAGTYTFSMPSNFSGTVELVDTFNGERTNLAMGDYSVYLEKGYIDERFVLEINVNEVPTAIDGVEDGTLKDGKAHKYLKNGVMYILRNGVQYDAQGKRVK